ncbi:MAG: hypothetical protein VX702_09615, partial [Pseudomonadota bacterium]|nr:hypothetical protein [Pseudomonadota bacterium]
LDGRLRIWLDVDRVHRGNSMIEGKVLRLSLAPEAPLPRAGTRLRTTARIYPPPRRGLHGAPDHSRRALARRSGCQRLCHFASAGGSAAA